jgi:hypothetical protein
MIYTIVLTRLKLVFGAPSGVRGWAKEESGVTVEVFQLIVHINLPTAFLYNLAPIKVSLSQALGIYEVSYTHLV